MPVLLLLPWLGPAGSQGGGRETEREQERDGMPIRFHRCPFISVHLAARRSALYRDDYHVPLSRQRHVSLKVDLAIYVLYICSPLPFPALRFCDLSFPLGEDDIHVVFSTDCTNYQAWQAVVLFHSAILSGHTGPITQLVS